MVPLLINESERLKHPSPGQRPGEFILKYSKALIGRNINPKDMLHHMQHHTCHKVALVHPEMKNLRDVPFDF